MYMYIICSVALNIERSFTKITFLAIISFRHYTYFALIYIQTNIFKHRLPSK